MENVKILVDGIQEDVHGLFYVFNSKYYFIYTEKEVDENNYVILYMVQVGKETRNTETGPVDTGYMVGVEITDKNEQQNVQTSISHIVEDKKNNTINPLIQYLPMSMLTNLKIVSKKRFRLLKSVMEENFKLEFENTVVPQMQPVVSSINSAVPSTVTENPQLENSAGMSIPLAEITPPQQQAIVKAQSVSNINAGSDIIIDYRSKYFEVEEKNKELQEQINELNQKLNDIKKVIE